MANLSTDSFFRRQMGKIKSEFGIDALQMANYAEIIQKRIVCVKDFNSEIDSRGVCTIVFCAEQTGFPTAILHTLPDCVFLPSG